MAKISRAFVCQSCGAVAPRWAGQCTSCGAWNSIVEEAATPPGSPSLVAIKGGKGRPVAFETLQTQTEDAPRARTGLGEFDRVTGGGLVPGSAILVGGDPGIGKSTLLLQVAARLASTGAPVVYLSGEEAPAQVRMRAERLGLKQAPVALGTETNLANIVASLQRSDPPTLIVIDSVQTLWSEGIDAAPGTISQLRACASAHDGRCLALRARSRQPRQADRLDACSRRPRHQGWTDRGSQSHRAHGGHRALFRRP